MSNLNQNDQEQLQLTIDQAKDLAKRKDALLQLQKSPHWKTLITDVYFKTEPVRLVMLKSDAHMQEKESQDALDKDILAIGSFRQFLHATIQLGHNAEMALEGHNETMDEIQNEEVDADESIDETGY